MSTRSYEQRVLEESKQKNDELRRMKEESKKISTAAKADRKNALGQKVDNQTLGDLVTLTQHRERMERKA